MSNLIMIYNVVQTERESSAFEQWCTHKSTQHMRKISKYFQFCHEAAEIIDKILISIALIWNRIFGSNDNDKFLAHPLTFTDNKNIFSKNFF